MNNRIPVSKILNLILIILDSITALFFLVSLILAITNVIVLGYLHLIILLIVLGINLIIGIYSGIILILDKKHKKF